MVFDNNFIIAEVGANHQGDVSLAMEYIEVFARLGASAIKFQTRNNRFLFSESEYNKPYNSNNAFGETYGEHREFLELSHEDLLKVKQCCVAQDVKFMSTAFDEASLDLLQEIGVDVLKVSSFDLGNISFLEKATTLKVPMVISCGGGSIEHVRSSVNAIRQQDSELPLSVLHCVSEYPCDPERLRLGNITLLQTTFPNCSIGLSDHFSGTLSGPIGALLGATVFEKHVTLNRAWKGTDHSFALEPTGFEKFVRDINRVPQMTQNGYNEGLGNEMVFKKLGKQIIATELINEGDVITSSKLRGQITGIASISVRDMYKVLNKKTKRTLKAGEPLFLEDLE